MVGIKEALDMAGLKKKVARRARRDFDRTWKEFWEKYMRFYGYNGRKK